VANSEGRQRRRQLQQDAIIDINFHSTAWINGAGEFLAYVRVYLEKSGTTKLPWSMTVIERVTATTNNMDRALKSAHMTCNDYEVIAKVTEAETHMASFLTLLNGPHPQDTAGLRSELTNVMTEGQRIQQEFATTTESLIRRGYKVYALNKGAKFRVCNRVAIWSQWVKQKWGDPPKGSACAQNGPQTPGMPSQQVASTDIESFNG
jgi:hypothetical protein